MTKTEEYQNALNAYRNLDVTINKTLRLIGISALEKQIPKKRIKEKLKFPVSPLFNDIVTYKCGNCGADISCADFYCAKCGNKIDWSDRE